MSQIIEYKGFKILLTAGFYWFSGLMFRTLAKAKQAIDNKIKEDKI
jgi:hypothetical protein